MSENLESTSFVQRIILCSLVEFSATDETPVDTAKLRESVTERTGEVDTDHVGRITEADVMRALNELSESSLVEERRPDDRSPVGKGRPQYLLSIDIEIVREELSEDDRVSPLLN